MFSAQAGRAHASDLFINNPLHLCKFLFKAKFYSNENSDYKKNGKLVFTLVSYDILLK